MAATSTCIRCFAGSYVGGVCNHCGKPLPAACEIVSTALPVGYVLHGRYYLLLLIVRGSAWLFGVFLGWLPYLCRKFSQR